MGIQIELTAEQLKQIAAYIMSQWIDNTNKKIDKRAYHDNTNNLRKAKPIYNLSSKTWPHLKNDVVTLLDTTSMKYLTSDSILNSLRMIDSYRTGGRGGKGLTLGTLSSHLTAMRVNNLIGINGKIGNSYKFVSISKMKGKVNNG